MKKSYKPTGLEIAKEMGSVVGGYLKTFGYGFVTPYFISTAIRKGSESMDHLSCDRTEDSKALTCIIGLAAGAITVATGPVALTEATGDPGFLTLYITPVVTNIPDTVYELARHAKKS